MSTEREAKALASGDIITVKGKDYKLRPVVAQHLTDLGYESLREYKRTYLQTYKDNADLLGEDASDVLRDKVDVVAKWTVADLPQMTAYDVSKVKVTEKLKKWIKQKFDEIPDTDEACRDVISTCLDSKDITPQKINELTGTSPRRGNIRYDQWWVTASFAGMISFIKSSMKDYPMEEVEKVSQWPFLKVIEAARIVERISSVDLGNG